MHRVWTRLNRLVVVACVFAAVGAHVSLAGHPRLYFNADDLPWLRQLKEQEPHRAVWANLAPSADWCATQPPRTEWIPTLADDPQYENLYDRFYGAMHDMAIVEHLAFASVLSHPEDDPCFEPARDWALGTRFVNDGATRVVSNARRSRRPENGVSQGTNSSGYDTEVGLLGIGGRPAGY